MKLELRSFVLKQNNHIFKTRVMPYQNPKSLKWPTNDKWQNKNRNNRYCQWKSANFVRCEPKLRRIENEMRCKLKVKTTQSQSSDKGEVGKGETRLTVTQRHQQRRSNQRVKKIMAFGQKTPACISRFLTGLQLCFRAKKWRITLDEEWQITREWWLQKPGWIQKRCF